MRSRTHKEAGLFYSKWFLLGIFICLIWVSTSYARAYYKDYKVREQITRLQEEEKQLHTKKLATLEALQYVKSTHFIEDKARTELGMVRPGEHVAVVEVPTTTARQVSPAVVSSEEQLSNPQKWWNYFFK
jgi:cell division protein FtsB